MIVVPQLKPILFYFILFVTFRDTSFWYNFSTSFNIYSVVCKTSVGTHLPSEKTFLPLLSAAHWDQLDLTGPKNCLSCFKSG